MLLQASSHFPTIKNIHYLPQQRISDMNFRRKSTSDSDASDAAASREEPLYYYHEQQQNAEQKIWMDAAYRRLGQKLSQRVENPSTHSEEFQPLPQNLGHDLTSAFSEYSPQLSNINPDRYYQRNFGAERDSCLKNLTINSLNVYQSVQKSATPSIISTSLRDEETSSCSSSSNTNIASRKGLLQSVLESQPANENRKCLSHPSEPVSNGGMDNSEANLICYEGDLIQPSRLHTLNSTTSNNRKEESRRIGRLRVLELLGQGTFAQVFGVECVDTGERFALKVVKNKQAYARQATIEIDVFRALVNSKKRLIELEAYFVYANHLCLLFEWLGPNLYEILKQRQFRGLPLEIVRSLLAQALEGLQELGNKSIIHCDLKPENILIVSSSLTDENIKKVLCRSRVNGDAAHPQQDRSNSDQDAQQSNQGKEMTQTQRLKKVVGKMNLKETRLTGSPPGVNAEDNHHMLSLANASDGVSETVSNSSGTSLTFNTTTTNTSVNNQQDDPIEESKLFRLKLIDFGSACFDSSVGNPEEQHKYIQSRFYRSPEVLVGLGYDSAIDMWSLGCVAAELFLGLPILPGNQEHDQIGRIVEMMGSIPDWMLEHGTKSRSFFVREQGESTPSQAHPCHPPDDSNVQFNSSARTNSVWRLKTAKEYLQSMPPSELDKRGGKASLVALAQQQKQHRYFEFTKLSDIILYHGRQRINKDEEELLTWFTDLLSGMLDPDPWKRWTASQASSHPFFTESRSNSNDVTKDNCTNGNNAVEKDIAPSREGKSWVPPWDPSICRRKLLFVQKVREKQRQRQRAPSKAEDKSYFPPMSGLNGSASSSNKTAMNAPETGSIHSGPSPPSSLLSSLSFRHPSVESSLGSASFAATRTYHSQQGTFPSSLNLFATESVPPSALSLGSASLSRSYNANLSSVGQTVMDQIPGPNTEFGYAISRPTGGVLPPHHHHPSSYQQQIPEELQLSGHSFPSSGMSSLHTAALSPTNQMLLSNSATLPLLEINATRNPMNIRDNRYGSLRHNSFTKPRMPPQPFTAKSHSYHHTYNSMSQQELPTTYASSISPSLLAQQLEKQTIIQQQQQQQWFVSQQQQQQRYPQQLSYSAGDYYNDITPGGGYVNEQQLQQQYYHTSEARNLYPPAAPAYQDQTAYSSHYNGQPQQQQRRPHQFSQH